MVISTGKSYMEKVDLSIEQPDRTFVRSNSHVRILDSRGNYLRSVLVGIKFGIFYFSRELIPLSLWPFVQHIVLATYYLVSNVWFVLIAPFKLFGWVLKAISKPLKKLLLIRPSNR